MRKKMKQKQREEFVETINVNKNRMTVDTLDVLTRKLLFFYHPETDDAHLVRTLTLNLEELGSILSQDNNFLTKILCFKIGMNIKG